MTAGRGNPWRRLGSGPLIAPSLLACDFMRAGEQIRQAVGAGAEVLHLDIMDGHFVPNLSMGPGFVRSVRRFTDHPLDVHLMVTDPGFFARQFAQAGADSVTFHIEADADHREIIRFLHDQGLGAGVTLRPGTAPETLEPLADLVDLVLVMTVEPGYGGQAFMPDQLEKVRKVRAMLGPDRPVEVDGGISPQTAAACAQAGANVFVAGVDIFGAGDIARAVSDLRNAALGAGKKV